MEHTPLSAEILERFTKFWDKAQKRDVKEPTAFSLATADKDGRPSSRMVLLKQFDERGLVFYTNFESRKARQLLENPYAAATFYWGGKQKQVHVEGTVERISDEQADAYWATRDRLSQIGAWASDQSNPMEKASELAKRVAKFTAKFGLGTVPRPPHWSGFRILPNRVEFWHGALHRLHEREVYALEGGEWTKRRLFP